MNFEPTEDRRMLADSLDRYIAEQYAFSVRDRIAFSEQGCSAEHWNQLAEIGALAALFPETVGGFGGAGFDVATVFECLGKGLVVEPVLGTLMVGRAIAHAGSTAQKRTIAALIDGSTKAALAHQEPGAHYETGSPNTSAEQAEGGWVIHGAKAVVQHGAVADLLLVSASTASTEGAAGSPQQSLFLVPSNTPGVQICSYSKIDGGRAAEIRFDKVRVSADGLLGSPGEGAAILEHAVGWGLLALASESLGAMDVAKRDTLEYLRTRKQFGAPIGSFQALQHQMADLLIEVEQARSAVINAAAAIDSPDRHEREKALSAAKYSVGQIGTYVAEGCIQLHGGIGMTWELPLSHYAKRLVMIDHELGDEDHHLARYTALSR